jgi:hypothetical protein
MASSSSTPIECATLATLKIIKPSFFEGGDASVAQHAVELGLSTASKRIFIAQEAVAGTGIFVRYSIPVNDLAISNTPATNGSRLMLEVRTSITQQMLYSGLATTMSQKKIELGLARLHCTLPLSHVPSVSNIEAGSKLALEPRTKAHEQNFNTIKQTLASLVNSAAVNVNGVNQAPSVSSVDAPTTTTLNDDQTLYAGLDLFLKQLEKNNAEKDAGRATPDSATINDFPDLASTNDTPDSATIDGTTAPTTPMSAAAEVEGWQAFASSFNSKPTQPLPTIVVTPPVSVAAANGSEDLLIPVSHGSYNLLSSLAEPQIASQPPLARTKEPSATLRLPPTIESIQQLAREASGLPEPKAVPKTVLSTHKEVPRSPRQPGYKQGAGSRANKRIAAPVVRATNPASSLPIMANGGPISLQSNAADAETPATATPTGLSAEEEKEQEWAKRKNAWARISKPPKYREGSMNVVSRPVIRGSSGRLRDPARDPSPPPAGAPQGPRGGIGGLARGRGGRGSGGRGRGGSGGRGRGGQKNNW